MSVFSLNYPILLRGIGVSALMKDSIGSKVLSEWVRKIFPTIVNPKDTNRGLKNI